MASVQQLRPRAAVDASIPADRGLLERGLLERIGSGTPLPEIFESIVGMIRERAPDMRCAVLLADESRQRLRFVTAPDIPEDYRRGIEPFLAVGPTMGSCGTAAFRRQPVYTRDTAVDPLWENCGGIAVRNGLRAIWSTPVLSSRGELIGTFAMYYGEPRLPTEGHIQLIDLATQLVRIAVEASPDAAHHPRNGSHAQQLILSRREQEVLQRVVAGQTSKQISAALRISPSSVDTYRSRLMAKLGVRRETDLVRRALELGLTHPL